MSNEHLQANCGNNVVPVAAKHGIDVTYIKQVWNQMHEDLRPVTEVKYN